MNTHIIALAGMPAVGKSTIARLMKKRLGFNWIRTRDVVAALRMDSAEESLQDKGLTLSEGEGARLFCRRLFSQIEGHSYSVIDAIRPFDHWRRLKKEFGAQAHLVAVVAPTPLRKKRFESRQPKDTFSLRDDHKVEREVPLLLEEAGYTLTSKDDLELRVDLMTSYVLGLPSSIDLLLTAHQFNLDPGTFLSRTAKSTRAPAAVQALFAEISRCQPQS